MRYKFWDGMFHVAFNELLVILRSGAHAGAIEFSSSPNLPRSQFPTPPLMGANAMSELQKLMNVDFA